MPGGCAVVLFDDIQLFAKSQHSLIGIPRSRSSDTETSSWYYAIRSIDRKIRLFVRSMIVTIDVSIESTCFPEIKFPRLVKLTTTNFVIRMFCACDSCWFLIQLFRQFSLLGILLLTFLVKVKEGILLMVIQNVIILLFCFWFTSDLFSVCICDCNLCLSRNVYQQLFTGFDPGPNRYLIFFLF